MPDLLDALNSRVTAIGAIVAAIVALNGALTSCSTDTVNRYAAFRAAVMSEENFWKDRFTEYGDNVALTDKAQRHGRMMALAALSQHQVPTFEEYNPGLFGVFGSNSAKGAARERLGNFRQSLMKVLMNDADPEVAELVRQSAGFERAQQPATPAQASVATTPGSVPAPAKAQAPAPSPSLETQVVGAGSDEGWDVDIFWCSTESAEADMQNYGYARQVASSIGKLANDRARFKPGVEFGRVQLRPLPQLTQGSGDYPVRGSGNILLVSDDSGEKEAAAVLLTVLEKIGAPFRQNPTNDQSPYYLSAFVCGSPAPAMVQQAAAD